MLPFDGAREVGQDRVPQLRKVRIAGLKLRSKQLYSPLPTRRIPLQTFFLLFVYMREMNQVNIYQKALIIEKYRSFELNYQ